MGRTKGSKNKVKPGSGNPEFNIASVEPSKTIGVERAASAILPEDLELDRELERLTMQEPPPFIDDPEPMGSIVKVEHPKAEMLKNVVECRPASTDQELREQIHTAKINDCDSIEVTLALAKRFCKDPTLESVGYFIMHDIKVYIEGAYEKARQRDRMTVEQRNFGGSKIA